MPIVSSTSSVGKSSTLMTTSLQRSRKRRGRRAKAASAIASSSARVGACALGQSTPLARFSGKDNSFLQGEVGPGAGVARTQETAQRLGEQHLLEPRRSRLVGAHALHPGGEFDVLVQALVVRHGEARAAKQRLPFGEAKA